MTFPPDQSGSAYPGPESWSSGDQGGDAGQGGGQGQPAAPFGSSQDPYGQPQPGFGAQDPYGAPQQPGAPQPGFGGAPPPPPPGYGSPYGTPGQFGAPPPGYGTPPYGAAGYGAPYGGGTVRSGTNGMAIASLILSILWFFGLGSLLAVIFGFVGTNQIRRRGQGGRGIAIAGIVIGFIGLAGAIIVIAVAATHVHCHNGRCTVTGFTGT